MPIRAKERRGYQERGYYVLYLHHSFISHQTGAEINRNFSGLVPRRASESEACRNLISDKEGESLQSAIRSPRHDFNNKKCTFPRRSRPWEEHGKLRPDLIGRWSGANALDFPALQRPEQFENGLKRRLGRLPHF